MNEVAILVRTQELLSDGNKWCKGEYARDSLGHYVGPLNPKAVAWCAIGGIVKMAGSYKDANFAIHWLTRQAQIDHNMLVTEYQDDSSTTHRDVFDLFSRAIVAARIGNKKVEDDLDGLIGTK